MNGYKKGRPARKSSRSWRYSQRVVVTERESHSHRCRQSEIVEDSKEREPESAVDPEDAE